jgi:hypothetical protein
MGTPGEATVEWHVKLVLPWCRVSIYLGLAVGLENVYSIELVLFTCCYNKKTSIGGPANCVSQEILCKLPVP